MLWDEKKWPKKWLALGSGGLQIGNTTGHNPIHRSQNITGLDVDVEMKIGPLLLTNGSSSHKGDLFEAIMLQVLIFMLQSPIARNAWHRPLATSFSLEHSCPSYTCAQRQWPKAFPELPEKVMAKVLSKYLKGIDFLDLLPVHKTITLITMKKALKASICTNLKFIFCHHSQCKEV